MNHLEKTIKKNLTNEQALTEIGNLQKTSPRHEYASHGVPVPVPVSIEISTEQFNYSKDILLQVIENGDFGKLPIILQSQMSGDIKNIINDPAKINNFIHYQQELYHSVFTSNLEYRLKGFNRYRNTLNNISKLKTAYDQTKESIDTITEGVAIIEKVHQDADECLKHIKEKSNTANTDRENISTVKKKVEEYQVETESRLKSIKEYEQEIENRKKDVLAFHNNIKNYQASINEKTKGVQDIIDKFDSQRAIVNGLIASAEEALQLKTAEGISAALSTQYEDIKNKKITEQWIAGAVFFVVVAIAGVVWLTLSGAEDFNAIISRLAVVAIAISAATFCAQQYTKQNDITENYAYKTVLAKSIVAFTEKIKQYDPEKSATFLEGAIQEINRSPSHEDKKEEGITENQINQLKKLANIVNIGKND